MDAKEYARFADILCQYRTKFEELADNCATAPGDMAIEQVLARILFLLRAVDHAAWGNDQGWI